MSTRLLLKSLLFKDRRNELNEYVMTAMEIDGKNADIQIGTTNKGNQIAIGTRTKNEIGPLSYIYLTKDEARRIIDTLQKLI